MLKTAHFCGQGHLLASGDHAQSCAPFKPDVAGEHPRKGERTGHLVKVGVFDASAITQPGHEYIVDERYGCMVRHDGFT